MIALTLTIAAQATPHASMVSLLLNTLMLAQLRTLTLPAYRERENGVVGSSTAGEVAAFAVGSGRGSRERSESPNNSFPHSCERARNPFFFFTKQRQMLVRWIVEIPPAGSLISPLVKRRSLGSSGGDRKVSRIRGQNSCSLIKEEATDLWNKQRGRLAQHSAPALTQNKSDVACWHTDVA